MQAVKSVHRPVKNKMNRNVYLIAAAIFWMAATGLGGASMLTKRWRSGNPLGSSYDLLEICKPSIGCVALSKWPEQKNRFFLENLTLHHGHEWFFFLQNEMKWEQGLLQLFQVNLKSFQCSFAFEPPQ